MSVRTVVLGMVLILAASNPGQADSKLTICVYNLAKVPDSVIGSAKGWAQRMFAESGASLEWMELETAEEVFRNPGGDIQILIIGRSLSLTGENTSGATMRGYAAWAFYDRVESFVARAG